MATTTNYGWTTPDDTALVKDGASAIRSLGTSVDTTTKNLNPSTTLGDIEYRSSTANTNTRLGIGSTGNVLTVAGGVPTWAAPAQGGGMTLIASITASAATSLSFTSIPSTYKHLLLTVSGTQSVSTQGWGVRFNNVSTGGQYAFDGFYVNAPASPNPTNLESWNANGFGTDNPEKFGLILSNSGGTSFSTSIGEMWVYDYTDATNQKVVRWSAKGIAEISGSAYGRYVTATGAYEEAAAISRIDFIRSSTQTFTGIVRLYGVS
jgi:hypothetical protein